MAPLPPHPNPLRTASIITAVSVLVSAGFSITAVVSPGTVLSPDILPTEASATFAALAAARSVPIALVTLAAIFRRTTPSLLLLAVLSGLVQALDAWVGFAQRDAVGFAAPAILAVLQFYAVALLVQADRAEHQRTASPN